ncbi:MAG: hypothetical protein KDK34_12195, partial [Leptospiraceae bacterium]|nr:hypothetical protein [Leptospiraceae bacterium]
DGIQNSAGRSEPPFLGLSSGAHWARITIKNNGQRTNFVLVNEFRRVQELELFSPDGRIYRTGMDIPIADRSLPIDELALPLEVGIGETKSILLRIRGESIPVYLPLVMFDEESFDRQLRWRDRITGLYFGALVVMFIYNLFLYVSLRDRTYLFYVLYLVSVIFLSLSQRDLLPESLFPAGSFRDRAGLPMGIMLAGAFSVLFAYHYLRIEKHEKLLRLIFIVTGIGFGGITFFSLFRILTGNEPAIGLLLLLFGLPLLVLIAAGRRALRGYRPAYVFLVAYFCLIFASLISVLSIRGLFPYHILGLYAGFIGTLVEMLLLSLGLAYRFREIEMESESARSAYRAKSEFLANMSHEIRTPLNAIVGATDMLMEASLGKQERKYIEIIQNTSGTLASLIDDILDIARIEAGRLEIKSVPFQVQELVENTLDLFSVQAAEKDIELSAYVDQSIPARVVGDSLRLRQILTNLMGNAIKFTERGEISVRVEHALQDGNMMAEHYRAFLSDRNINLLFQIRDTGIGIPIEKWEIIFSSFAQADSTITRQYGGSGLGLAICRQLSELMGGYIWVDSLPENGSSFYVMLPFQPDGQWEVGAPPESKNRSVLVVDKNETSQYI